MATVWERCVETVTFCIPPCIKHLFITQAAAEDIESEAEDASVAAGMLDFKALSTSVVTLAELVRDQRAILDRISSIETNGEAIADGFIKHITFAIGFVGAGLVFGQKKLPCGAVIFYIWINFVVFVVASIYAGSQMIARINLLNPQHEEVKMMKSRLRAGLQRLLTAENDRINRQRTTLQQGGHANLEAAALRHPNVTSKKLVERVKAYQKDDLNVTIGNLTSRTLGLAMFYVLVYGAVILSVSIFTHRDAKDNCNVAALAQDL